MPTEDRELDDPFFREWTARRPGDRRSLARAARLAAALGLHDGAPPVLTVVGSKGKGTAALYASAACAAAGLRVGTLSSPALRTNRERIRVDGRALDRAAYAAISAEVDGLLRAHGRTPGDDGYLSPTGLYTLAGVAHMRRRRCDVLVLEAGMGGRADEVSLLAPAVVAVTRIFGEHLGVLGPDVAAIARDKLGVARATTRAIVSVPQDHPDVRAACAGAPVAIVDAPPADAGGVVWPPGLSAANAWLGCAAAMRLLAAIGRPPPDPARLRAVLATVRPLGRLSQHADGDGRTWTVDAAVDPRGAAAAVAWHEAHVGPIDTLLVCLPTGKDVAGVRRALGERPLVAVRLRSEHLRFGDPAWQGREIAFADVDAHLRGRRVLALGTWSFVGAVLARLDVDVEAAFAP